MALCRVGAAAVAESIDLLTCIAVNYNNILVFRNIQSHIIYWTSWITGALVHKVRPTARKVVRSVGQAWLTGGWDCVVEMRLRGKSVFRLYFSGRCNCIIMINLYMLKQSRWQQDGLAPEVHCVQNHYAEWWLTRGRRQKERKILNTYSAVIAVL